MDELQRALENYKKVMGKYFIYTLDDGREIILKCGKRNLRHLLGLHKLVDKPNLSKAPPDKVFKSLNERKITFSYLKTSKFFAEIEERIKFFDLLPILATSKYIIDFDPHKLQNCKLQSKFLFFKIEIEKNKPIYLYLGIKEKRENPNVYCPETFMVQRRQPDKYCRNQKLTKIINIRILEAQAIKKAKKCRTKKTVMRKR
ncbi:PBECR4 domain-containing protein [Anaerocellum danielii]|uniref:PBECR4 domain-containing protein n=1 Tax=Anaerocellum danielii TaxID=1387557 RepID=A0ABZ0U3A4_9FIRM|nr:PBECR4 domain-containing protein [Caldicellulosiruptor danielii]WPX08180.1 PBECR4 domain-containing protein [Caldicellulosiruptor danielii]